MKGWVYVITNRAMPGLVKVGYSSNDPDLRAAGLNHTGSPHPYLVEYEALVNEPFGIEQRTHKSLSHLHEGELYQKGVGIEWFNCSIEEAISAIKTSAGAALIIETYKGADRKKAEELHRQKTIEENKKREREAAEKELEQKLSNEESEIRQSYQRRLESEFAPKSFWVYWLGGAALCLVAITILIPKATDGAILIMCAIGGAIAGTFLQSYFEDKKKKSPEYLYVEKQRDAALAKVRLKTIPQQVGMPSTNSQSRPVSKKTTATHDATLQHSNALDDQDVKESMESQGNHSALENIKNLAEQGNAEAQAALGLIYADGSGETKNYQTALKWLRLSAEQGDSGGMFGLGMMYHSGFGVLQDYDKAMEWFLSAADGNPERQQELLKISEQRLQK